jgi:hypothetical protein
MNSKNKHDDDFCLIASARIDRESDGKLGKYLKGNQKDIVRTDVVKENDLLGQVSSICYADNTIYGYNRQKVKIRR